MSRSRQKDTVRARELILEPKKLHKKQELIRFKLRKSKIVNIDDELKRIYRIEN